MDQKPFRSLKKLRYVNRLDLPGDLAEFYAQHEGIGINAPNDHCYDLCKLNEIEQVGWADISHLLSGDGDRPWAGDFKGLLIGRSSFNDLIVYVHVCPWSSPSSIVTIGPDIAGNHDVGPTWWEGVLILAPSFSEWLERLEKFDWVEYGLAPSCIEDLAAIRQQEIRGYFKNLNPLITWG